MPHPLAAVLVGLIPHSRLKTMLMNRLLGWSVHPTASVAPCLFLRITHVSLGAGSRLLGFSVFFDVDQLLLGDDAVVGRWNWVSAARELRTPVLDARAGGHAASLRLGGGGAITSRHYIDCSGGVDLGAFTVLAGVRSTVLSHQLDVGRSEQDVQPVSVGDYCFVGSNTKIVPGASIPDRCVIAMGSVVAGALPDEGFLYAGVPARAVKPLENGLYFTRTDADAAIP